VPAGIAGFVLLLGGAAFAASRSGRNETPVLQSIASQPVSTPNQPAQPGVRTDSAAGTVGTALNDSVFAAIRDSITAADEARRARRQRAAAAAAAEEAAASRAEQRPRTVTDSTGTVWMLDKPPGFGTNQVIAPPDTTKPRIDTVARPPRPDTTLVLPPLLPKVKPDTVKPKPDTLVCCRN
jgi:hypothetical protein